MATVDELITELAPVVSVHGVDLDEVNLSKAGNRRVLTIALDCDGGVDLDVVAAVSRSISEHLDESDIMGAAPYVLEVSSRGVDKPLLTPTHWRRNNGRLVKVVGSAIDAVGRITSSDDTSVTLNIKGQNKTVAFDDISKAMIQVEFNRVDTTDELED